MVVVRFYVVPFAVTAVTSSPCLSCACMHSITFPFCCGVQDDGSTSTAAVPVRHLSYLGFIDVADLVTALLAVGLTPPAPHGLLAKLKSLLADDSEYHVRRAVNQRGHGAFFGIPQSETIGLVCVRLSFCVYAPTCVCACLHFGGVRVLLHRDHYAGVVVRVRSGCWSLL